jgi:hypothetical protein
MPRKGDRHPPPCVKCGRPCIARSNKKGQLKHYLRTCEEHFNYHHKLGPTHPNATRGGRFLNWQGYVQVLDPRRVRAKKHGSNYILEHRLVMETILGRPLRRVEVVHHLNGVRDDNRPENLAVLGPEEEHESQTYVKALQRRIRELELEAALRLAEV